MVFRARRGGGDVLTTRRTHDVLEATARISAPREAVWSVIWSPETAQLIWPEILHSVVLPGTGPGVGEIHVHVERTAKGALTLNGVVVDDCRPPEFVRYRGLDEAAWQSTTEITFTTETPLVTAVRWVVTLDWEAGFPNGVVDQVADNHRAFVTTYLRGSGHILNAPIDFDGCWRLT